MSKVYVIIVTYNGMKWIKESLSSLYGGSFPIDVIVIDNNSSDETVTCIKKEFPNVILFEQNENLGFGKANNIGMSYALKQNVDFVFLLNQDAFVNKMTIENLVSVAMKNSEYGILSPIQSDYSGKLLETYFFRFMSEDSSRTFYSDFVLENQQKEIYDINFVQAASWLLPINTLKKIGGFDPLFYHYGEDNNYCQRVLYHKMKIGVVPEAFIRHDSHKSKKNDSPLFSKKYFDNYQKEIYCKYADINKSFGVKEIEMEFKKINKQIFKSLINFNFTKLYGYLKQARFFKNQIEVINSSRITNKNIYFNHLEIE